MCKNTYGNLLLSKIGTTDYLYSRVLYDIEGSVIWQYSKKRPLLTKFSIMIVKINAFGVSMIFFKVLYKCSYELLLSYIC